MTDSGVRYRIDSTLSALRGIRNERVGLLEEKLVDMMSEALGARGIPHDREVPLAPGCRIDLTVPLPGTEKVIGIEAKKGRPRASSVEAQVTRYANTGRLAAIIFVAERTFDLPEAIAGIPVHAVSLDAALGIAL